MTEKERTWLRAYEGQNRLVVTGEDSTGLGDKANLIRIAKCPGKDYTGSLQKNFEGFTPDQEHKFLESLGPDAGIHVLASPMIATSIACVDGKPHVFFANFAGLRGGANLVQTPQTDVQVTVAATPQHRGFFLPFLGEVQPVEGTASPTRVTFKLPAVEKRAVFWYEP